MKIDWLNGALQLIPESKEEGTALSILYYGLPNHTRDDDDQDTASAEDY